MKLINSIKDEQMARLEPLYPKWVQFKNEKTLRLTPEQVALMGKVWSELTEKRWLGGCQACTMNAFSQVMTVYDAELDRRFKVSQEQSQGTNLKSNRGTNPESNQLKQQTNATTKKRVRRIKG